MVDLILAVDSLTGQGKRFAEKVGYPVFDIGTCQPSKNQHVILVTRSYNFGEIPETTRMFIDAFRTHIIGVVVGGNRTWGKNFGAAGEKIQAKFGIPLIHKFEGTGFPNEVAVTKAWIETKLEELNRDNT
jgi:protein involved in ribonucleotide reduction